MNYENIDRWYTRNIDIPKRTIYFGPWQPNEEMIADDKSWEVNDFTIQNIIKGLYILEQSKVAPITIIWTSYGGDWDAGMSLYDYIKEIKSPVTMKAYGRIRSMGTIIMQACKRRLLSPHCLFMIHYGTSGHETTHSKDLINFAEIEKMNNNIMENIYLKQIKKKKKNYTQGKLSEFMKYDRYLIPEKAIEMGLADGVIK